MTEELLKLVKSVEYKKFRSHKRAEFASKVCNINPNTILPIAADCSFRTYYRAVTKAGLNVLIMDCPPEVEDVLPFVTISKLLESNGFSTPKIYEQDLLNSFLLIEDFGDFLYTKLLGLSLASENELYKHATDVLIEVSKIKTSELALEKQTKNLLVEELKIYTKWYFEYLHQKPISLSAEEDFFEIVNEMFNAINLKSQTLVLRDYHADNLMWLNQRAGLKKVGILDYQDALIGSSSYDLVSLLQDARRDVNEQMQTDLVKYFAKSLSLDYDNFFKEYNTIGLQRNLRILGVFARKFMRDGSKSYLKFIPRVISHIYSSLRLLGATKLKKWIISNEL